MTDHPLEKLLRRDQLIVVAALGAVTILAWIYLAASARLGAEGAMAGMDMGSARFEPWSTSDLLLMFAMWTAMMIGMMIPSAAPMLLLYARVARQAQQGAHPFAPTAWFAAGYLLAWTLFAAFATVLQWLLESAALMTGAMALASRPLAGALLLAAGIYQWTPLKHACLSQCRSPFQFIQAQGGFRGDRRGSVRLGLAHGAFCVGCCWALMLLLFFLGVMNFLWIALLAALVLVEKAYPTGRGVARAAGIACILAGAWLIFAGPWLPGQV